MKKGYLVLENGQIFEGTRFGADGETLGELVFTTGCGGYIDTLTDSVYYGQIIMQTFPSIGNIGWIDADAVGKEIKAKAYVVRECCENPSNFRTDRTLDEELKRRGVIGLCDLDTRNLTTILRENGTMNAAITSDPKIVNLTELKAYKVENALANVCTKNAGKIFKAGNENFKVTLIDYGSEMNLIAALNAANCSVKVVSYDTSAEQILADSPDGVVLSNGAGNPADNTAQVTEVKNLLGKLPLFGLSLGHQLLALATGAKTIKLKYGHRGANQPIKDLTANKTYITSQNHGYAVDSATLKNGDITFVNNNDGTCEGIDYKDLKAFSIQFVMQTGADSAISEKFIIDKFVDLMKENK